MCMVWELRGESICFKTKTDVLTLSLLPVDKVLRNTSTSGLSSSQAPRQELVCPLAFLPPSLHNSEAFLFASPWPRCTGKLESDGLEFECPATPGADTTCHSYSPPSSHSGPSTSRPSHYFFIHTSFGVSISSLPSFSVTLPLMHLYCSSSHSNIRNAHY